jgi:hypothetical protein
MKTIKKLVVAGLSCLAVTWAQAATPKGPGIIANESSLAVSSKTYAIPLNSYGIDQEAFQVVWSTPTISSVTFTDGSVSTFTITVTSSPIQGIPYETICINGICLADGNQWNHDAGQVAQSSTTACSMAAAVNASTSLNTVVVSTCVAKSGAGSIVATTSTIVGVNYATYSSSQSALTLSPYSSSSPVTGYGFGTMTGGTSASYTLVSGSATVISATNPYSPIGKTPMVALPVLYVKGTNAITGLTTGTTYYVIPVTLGAFGLSTTSTGAAAGYAALPAISMTNGTFIPLTSSQTIVTADSYSLTASSYTATTTITWQVSNDGMNWTTYASTGPVILTPVYPSTNYGYDTGMQNFGFLQASVVRSGATAGWSDGLQLLITVNGKNSGL